MKSFKMTSRYLLRCASAVGALAFAVQASAQEAGNTESAAATANTADDGEIVVTAQRRSQNLQDVPIAVTALSGAELQARQVTSSMDVARITPGVYASAASAGQTSAYAIRGVVQNDVSGTAEGPVAVYIDDAYSPNVQAQSFGLYDLERVEVLKGPQGTLFGRNSTGGLVNFVIVKPSDTPSGYINATYGSYDTVKVEGALGGPLGEGLQARASGFYHRNDGYLKNLVPGKSDLGGQETFSGRLQLQATPTDALKIRVSGAAFHQDFSTAPYSQISTRSITDGAGQVVGGFVFDGPDAFGYTAPPAKRMETGIDFACNNCGGVRIYNGGLHVDYDLGGATISAITNYQHVKNKILTEADVSPLNLVDVAYSGTTDSFSQEIRISGESDRLVWNAGAFYLNILSKTANGFLARSNSIFAGVFGLGPTGVDLLDLQRLRTQSHSIFGQAEYKLTDQFSVIIGARGTHERQKYGFSSSAYQNIDDYTVDTATALFPLQPSFDGRESENLWAAKLSLQYKPSRDFLAYATISRGVKGGNFNEQLPSGAPPLNASQFYYKPEVLLDYEAGIKATVLDGLLAFDASAYYYDYSDFQALVFTNLSGIISNNDAKIYGGELQTTLKPARGLEISGSFSYVHATVKDVSIAPGVVRDVKPPFSPPKQFSGRISYTPDLDVAGGKLTFAIDIYSTDDFYQNIRNFSSQRLEGYTTVGAQVSWVSENGFSLTGSAVNLFDKRYAITGYDTTDICGCSSIAYGKPRWLTVTAGYRF